MRLWLPSGFAGDCICGLCAGTRDPARRLATDDASPRMGELRMGEGRAGARLGDARGGMAGLNRWCLEWL